MESTSRALVARGWPYAVLACVLLYGALLRMDALVASFGPYQQPAWLAAMQPGVRAAASVLLPRPWHWEHVAEPYEGGDPRNYLRFAREMRHFYQAHVREPMFLAATRAFLLLTHDADVGISLTSISFSLLTMVATFAVGCQIASPAVGLAAAAALAVDRDAVDLSIGGWRDEMFSFVVVLSVWGWLRMARRERGGGMLAGTIGAAACLTRITAITTLTPAWLWLVAVRDAARRRARITQLGVAIAVTTVLVAPYLVNCAVQFGDPFFAINDHTRFYRGREGTTNAPKESAVRYVVDKVAARPVATLDTAVWGLVVYPFSIKWTGIDAWLPGLGSLLSWFSVAGLVAWLWQPSGRLLLLVLGGSLVPYMLTWVIPGGGEWRFTLHAYPFYLLAAFWMMEWLVGAARTALGRGAPATLATRPRQQVVVTATVLAALALTAVGWTFAMPYLIARESLLAGDGAGIIASSRDRWLFTEGWSSLVVSGNVVSRFTTQASATMRIPLPEARPYKLILRMDPFHYADAPPQNVRVLLNQQPVGAFDLAWNPDRIGEYQVLLPVHAARVGANVLTVASDTLNPIGRAGRVFPEIPRDEQVGIRLWYVRIVPASGAAGA